MSAAQIEFRPRWRAKAPAWAQEQWQRYSSACQKWCAQNRIGLSLETDAHFQQEISRDALPG